MRLQREKVDFLVSIILKALPSSEIYLFGSRTNDNSKGGDIDICILSDEKCPFSLISQVRTTFFKKFGIQKLDLLNYTKEENNTFKKIILSDAIKLN